MSPAGGVSITVTASDSGLRLVSDAIRVSQVLESAMERACQVASSSISLAVCAADADHVLFSVTHDGAAGPADCEARCADGNGAATRVVGIASVADPALRARIVALLDADVPTGSSAGTYQLHGRQHEHGSPSSGVVAPSATSSPRHPAGPCWRGFGRAAMLATALGGHIGIVQDARRGVTRMWMLLPAERPRAFGSASALSVSGHGRRIVVETSDGQHATPAAAAQSVWADAQVAGTLPHGASIYAAALEPGGQDASHGEAVTIHIRPAVLPAAAAPVAPASADRVGGRRVPDAPGPVLSIQAPAVARGAFSVAADAAAGPGASRPRAVRRALIVDDEAVLRHLVGRMFQRLGIAHDALDDGSEVAGALTPEHDLILLDIVMKHSDGVQVCATSCAELLSMRPYAMQLSALNFNLRQLSKVRVRVRRYARHVCCWLRRHRCETFL